MITNKKQNRIKTQLPIVVLIILLLGLFALSSWLNTDKYFCPKNPDKCVIEFICEYEDEDRNCFGLKEYPRKKTPKELLIEDCNNNPREDEKCKCEEEFVCYTQALFQCEDFTIGLNVQKGETCIPEYKIEGCMFIQGAYKTRECFKSRPKTECEKGNPRWVEEKIKGITTSLCDERGKNCQILDQQYDTICRKR